MNRPWSIRVMSGRGSNRSEIYTVPAGRRLVILHVLAAQWDTKAGAARLDVHGIAVIYFPLTTGPTFQRTSCRYTAYEGETVIMTVWGTDVSYAVDGYLLNDPTGAPDDADNVIVPAALSTAETTPLDS